MPIAVLCPTCSARLNAPDASAGKKVKCPKCHNPMMIPGPAAAPVPPPPPSRPAPAAPPPAPAPRAGASPFDFDAAASSGRKTGRRQPDPEPLDLGDDEPPPARRGPAGRRPSRPRDEDDEDDRPRRRPPVKTGGPPLVLILAIVGVLGLFCVGGVGVGAYYLFVKKDDTTAGTTRATAPDGSARAAVPAGWKEFRPARGGFKAYFPSEPAEKGAAGLTIYSSQSSQQKVLCQLLVTRLSDIPAKERNTVVDEVINGMTRAPGARQLSRRDARLAGQPATEVVVELPDAAVKGPKRAGGKAQLVARILKTDTMVYAMTISNTEPGRPPDALVNGFFDNFAVVD